MSRELVRIPDAESRACAMLSARGLPIETVGGGVEARHISVEARFLRGSLVGKCLLSREVPNWVKPSAAAVRGDVVAEECLPSWCKFIRRA